MIAAIAPRRIAPRPPPCSRLLAVAALGLSALVVLVVRARFDPWLNEGTPTTLRALWDVLARRQYEVAPLWPRQAPPLGAGGELVRVRRLAGRARLSTGVAAPAWWRTPITVLFALLGVRQRAAPSRATGEAGARCSCSSSPAQRGRRSLYLNFKAGASFGWGVLPDSAPHEVRDRDYFFVLGFWVWGAWAGSARSARGVAARVMAARAPAGPCARGRSGLGRPGRCRSCCNALASTGAAWTVAAEPRDAGARRRRRDCCAPLRRTRCCVTGGDNDSFPVWYAAGGGGRAARRHDGGRRRCCRRGWYRAELAPADTPLLSHGDVAASRGSRSRCSPASRARRATQHRRRGALARRRVRGGAGRR